MIQTWLQHNIVSTIIENLFTKIGHNFNLTLPDRYVIIWNDDAHVSSVRRYVIGYGEIRIMQFTRYDGKFEPEYRFFPTYGDSCEFITYNRDGTIEKSVHRLNDGNPKSKNYGSIWVMWAADSTLKKL